jgi:Domain of Unknown Function (DUF1543)
MQNKLYMVLIGATPKGRNIEQHDICFGIAPNMAAMVPQLQKAWPEAAAVMHVDAYRQVNQVDGYAIEIVNKADAKQQDAQLFFINLGGYKANEFEEFHYKMIVAAADKSTAIKQAKQTAFYKHTGFKGAESHIDDKYGIDVDDVHAIDDLLPQYLKDQFAISISKANQVQEDEMHLGYFILKKLLAGEK